MSKGSLEDTGVVAGVKAPFPSFNSYSSHDLLCKNTTLQAVTSVCFQQVLRPTEQEDLAYAQPRARLTVVEHQWKIQTHEIRFLDLNICAMKSDFLT
jgi:hypothetical protein